MDTIINEMKDIYSKNIKLILDEISIDYNIDKYELYKYLEKKKKKNNNLSSTCSELCMARKQDGNQCTRKKKFNDYCGKHINSHKYGRIDDSSNLLEDYSEDENYIMVWKEKYENIDYLVDSNNIVYTNNIENPEIIGRKVDKLIEFI